MHFGDLVKKPILVGKHKFVVQRGALLGGVQFVPLAYSVGEVVSDLFGLEDTSVLEEWSISASCSEDAFQFYLVRI